MKPLSCLLTCCLICLAFSVRAQVFPDSNFRYRNQDSAALVLQGDTISSGMKILKFENGKTSASGNLTHWLRDGWWTIYRSEDGSKASEVLFKNGKGTVMKLFDNHGDLTGTIDTVEKEANFPGGDPAWKDYCRNALMSKIDLITKKKGWGIIEVEWIITKTGTIASAHLTKSSGTVSDNIVLDIIRNAPRWNPAMQYNRNVIAYRKQKFTLQPPG